MIIIRLGKIIQGLDGLYYRKFNSHYEMEAYAVAQGLLTDLLIISCCDGFENAFQCSQEGEPIYVSAVDR